MNYMFSGCRNLIDLELSSFNTSNVTDVRYMFNECSSLVKLDLSHFNTSKVIDMRYMFNKCSALETLNLSNFDTSEVTNMEFMFYECTYLTTTLTISNPNLTGYASMFLNTSTAEGTNVTINYTNETIDLVDLLIETKSDTSNVVKGALA